MKKKRNKKTMFALAIITLVVLAFISFSSIPGSPIHSISGPLSVLTAPIHRFTSKIVEDVSGFVYSVREAERIRKDNIELQEKNSELELRIKELEENSRRWEELKEAFQIKEIFSDYTIIGASVLTRDIGEWFDVFRVDAGSSRDIDADGSSFAVVDPQMNLVGRVFSSDIASSKILPVTNEYSVVSAKLDTAGGALLKVKGDILLKENNICIGDDISEFSSVHIGDEVITSGLGGLFPAGIPIGKVTEIIEDGPEANRIVLIEVYADYKTLKDVFIMKGDKILE